MRPIPAYLNQLFIYRLMESSWEKEQIKERVKGITMDCEPMQNLTSLLLWNRSPVSKKLLVRADSMLPQFKLS